MKTAAIALLGVLAAMPAAASDRDEHQQVLKDIDVELEAGQRELSHALAQLAALGVDPMRDRAYLGIALDDGGDGSDGVRVKGVTPDGPAHKAGLKTGDVITALNGKSLARDGTASPARKLIDEMKNIKPGTKVAIAYTRDGKAQSTTVETGEFPRHLGHHWQGDGGNHGAMAYHLPMHHLAGFGELELTALNPDLGAYFGAATGVLVVQGPASEAVPLKGGDVILKIGERVPANPSQTWRILSSYDQGEKIPLTIMRQRKQQEISLTRQ